MKPCKTCGCQITDGDLDFVVNLGLPSEYSECEYCHGYSLDNHDITICSACGEYFSLDVLKDEIICGESFCRCPSCGCDIIEGLTEDEFRSEYEDVIPLF